MTRIIISLAFLFAAFCPVFSQRTEREDSIIKQLIEQGIIEPRKQNWLEKWWASIAQGNVDHTFDRPIDITFAASPYYSAESSVGIGGQLSALYRLDKTDKTLPPSDVSLIGGGSVNGTYSVGISGNTYFNRKDRVSYSMQFKNQRKDFWGINYADCNINGASPTRVQQIVLNGDYQRRFVGNWFWGAALRVKYITSDPDSLHYLRGQKKSGTFTGVGVLIQYDSRDFPMNPKRGMYFLAREVVYPGFLCSLDKPVYTTTYQFNAYHKVWKNAILAYDLFGEFNSSSDAVPWQLREEINADDRRMRGYYTGCYIDENQMCAQVELRQHIAGRWGATAWVGAGTLFTKFSEINGAQILPNAGVGVRFELKANTNIRMDFGVGRGRYGISFSFGEAF